MSNNFDINKIATDLNGKADLDLTNTIGALSASSKNYFSGLGMPGDKYIDLTLGLVVHNIPHLLMGGYIAIKYLVERNICLY